MVDTRRGTYDYMPCEGVSISAASKKLLHVLGIGKLNITFLYKNPIRLVLGKVLHVPYLKETFSL